MTASPALTVPGARHLHSGKVRDLYELPDGTLLMVASDRISAYDFVPRHPDPRQGRDPHPDVAVVVRPAGRPGAQPRALHRRARTRSRGRAVVCERLDDVPGRVRRPRLPDRLRAARLPRDRRRSAASPLPAGLEDGPGCRSRSSPPPTKAALGEHDENVSFDAGRGDRRAPSAAAELRDLTLASTPRAEEIARERGIILADTKLEFGRAPRRHARCSATRCSPPTPRASGPPTSGSRAAPSRRYDKQYRARLADLAGQSGWDRAPGTPPPPLPDDVVERTRARYVEAYERLTGETF